MAGFDYDVVIVGSGFGGSVAALRAVEKGYRVGVIESGTGSTRSPWRRPRVPSRLRSLPRVCAQPRGPESDPDRDEARLPDPGRGNGPGPDGGRPGAAVSQCAQRIGKGPRARSESGGGMNRVRRISLAATLAAAFGTPAGLPAPRLGPLPRIQGQPLAWSRMNSLFMSMSD